MFKFANIALVVATLLTGSTLYSLEHVTRGHERSIAKAKAEMEDTAEAIKLLKAEWSSLTRPERVQALAAQHLGLKKIEPDQYVTQEELPARLKALATATKPEKKGTIDDLLQKMQ
jgi:cell division protein FtsL